MLSLPSDVDVPHEDARDDVEDVLNHYLYNNAEVGQPAAWWKQGLRN